MALTLLALVQRVARNIGLDPSFTTFSNSDETLDLVQDINTAYEELIQLLPPRCPLLHKITTLTTTPGVRLYSLPADAPPANVHWGSFRATPNRSLFAVTPSYILAKDSQYTATAGQPQYVYLASPTQVGLYPVPTASESLQYSYMSQPIRLTNPADTFTLPDRWLLALEKKAQFLYEKRKGFGQLGVTAQEADARYMQVLAEAWAMASPDKFY